MIHLPKLPYNGITIVMSNPSRFDIKQLLSGPAGYFFNGALRPETVREACEIRLLSLSSGLTRFSPGTKVVLMMGDACIRTFLNKPDALCTTYRGSVYSRDGIYFIPTVNAQDCMDIVDHESRLNPLLKDVAAATDDDNDDEEGESKDAGKTARKNYRFWFKKDVKKLLRVLRNGPTINVCDYVLCPPASTVIDFLDRATSPIHFDIECDIVNSQLICFSVSTDAKQVVGVPWITHEYKLWYSPLESVKILRALAVAFDRCGVVIHNAKFDLFIMAWKHRIIPPRKIEDTMIMQHRLSPETEKSLAHAISAHTDEVFHKDESGSFVLHTPACVQRILKYNAKDVERMALVRTAQWKEAEQRGITKSLEWGNRAIRPYLLLELRGLPTDLERLCYELDTLNRRINFFETKVIPKICGWAVNPGSWQQVSKYLYEQLGLPEPKGKVSHTGEIQILRLATQFNVPFLRVLLHLRGIRKERGSLKMRLWEGIGVLKCENVDKGGRVTGAYKVDGTDTFRLRSRKLFGQRGKKNVGWGTNLQNWSKHGQLASEAEHA